MDHIRRAHPQLPSGCWYLPYLLPQLISRNRYLIKKPQPCPPPLRAVAAISHNIPQNLTSPNVRCTGIAKSYFIGHILLSNRSSFERRTIESPGSFKGNLLSYLWGRISDAINSSDAKNS